MTLAAAIERSKRNREDWKYTDLPALLARRAQNAPIPMTALPATANDDARLVFVNGVFQPAQSRFGSIPSCILMGDERSGYKLTLGEHTCLVAQPVELVFTTDETAADELDINLSIDIGANGRLTLLERHLPSRALSTIDINVTLHESAKFVHGKMTSGGAHIARTNVNVARGGYYSHFGLTRGGLPMRHDIDVHLMDEQAQAALHGVMLLRGGDHADITTRIAHNAPHGVSRQMFKTVLADKSRGVFQGKIYVAPHAQKTDGHQISRALLLSDSAEMDAKPELEIYADDVKCSHGSTIGDLDADALFYLRARGLSETQARALLIDAFTGEVIDDIPVPAWRDLFRADMEGWQS